MAQWALNVVLVVVREPLPLALPPAQWSRQAAAMQRAFDVHVPHMGLKAQRIG